MMLLIICAPSKPPCCSFFVMASKMLRLLLKLLKSIFSRLKAKKATFCHFPRLFTDFSQASKRSQSQYTAISHRRALHPENLYPSNSKLPPPLTDLMHLCADQSLEVYLRCTSMADGGQPLVILHARQGCPGVKGPS